MELESDRNVIKEKERYFFGYVNCNETELVYLSKSGEMLGCLDTKLLQVNIM